VRVLMGSTSKMGAGTNCQDRLVALHDLDCPWRPGDLEQRSGRIIRQGNQNKQVHIYRYATEQTFDSYLWQTVENKQKFISQIMTSKSPARSCEDIDETALSYAEIKALCAGNPAIREKMNLDVEISKLRMLKGNHQTQQHRMQDNLLKHFPEQIRMREGMMARLKADLLTVRANTPSQGEFHGMEVRGVFHAEKEAAGKALLEACKTVTATKAQEGQSMGSYRGFPLSLSVDAFKKEVILTLQGEQKHSIPLGTDTFGNLTRIDNALANLPKRVEEVQRDLDNLAQQMISAKQEVGKPFPQEAELAEKSARLSELDAMLNMEAQHESREAALEKEEDVPAPKRPSVRNALKAPCQRGDRENTPQKAKEAAR